MGGIFKSVSKIFRAVTDPIGELFGGSSKKEESAAAPPPPPPAPEPPPTLLTPTAMPTPTSGDQRVAKRRAQAQQLSRRGRDSTILTGDSDSLG